MPWQLLEALAIKSAAGPEEFGPEPKYPWVAAQ
jgi:hypothetical protein